MPPRVTVSHSSLRTFRECPQRYYYRYIRSRVPLREDDKLAFGRAFHAAVARWWADGPLGAVSYLTENAGSIDVFDAVKICAMLEQYNPPIEEYHLLGTEVPFRVPVRTPYGGTLWNTDLVGYADGVLQHIPTGRTVIHEIKTTVEQIIGFGPYWARIGIDQQISTYQLALKTDGIVYDVLKKPQLRPSAADRKRAAEIAEENGLEGVTDAELSAALLERTRAKMGENPEEWHQFRPVWTNERDQESAAWDLYATVRQLREAITGGGFPKYGHSCRTMFGLCPYLGVCSGRASLDDDAAFTDRSSRAREEASDE